ncbi:hypothetical protein PTI98_009608 [Pleurotus ostreatus]|nr:hypothetical protein PTI98_009608 [Pleurotus ostreatus]
MPGEGRATPVDTNDGPLEQRVVGLESSVREILDLLRTAANTPPQPPPAPPVQPVPVAPVVSNSQGPPPYSPMFPLPRLTPLSHEFKPQQLGKLIPSITAKATTTTYALEDGALRATDTAPIKDLPDFSTFMRALGIYFQILYRYIGTTGSIQAVIDVAVSTQGYTNLLHEYSRYFTYPAILTYHIAHHSRRIREMLRGDYSLWADEDRALVGQLHRSNIFQEVKSGSATSSKSKSTPSATTTRDVSNQVCNRFNNGACSTTPCKSGRLHKCAVCGSTAHGKSTCTQPPPST